MIIILGFGFMFVFTAFQTMCNIEVSTSVCFLSARPGLFVCVCVVVCVYAWALLTSLVRRAIFVLVLANRRRSSLGIRSRYSRLSGTPSPHSTLTMPLHCLHVCVCVIYSAFEQRKRYIQLPIE